MATLKKLHKIFIIQQFAMFSTPSEIIAAVKEEFDLEVSKQQLNYWNPNVNKLLGKEWLELFQTSRTQFQNDTLSIPIANKAFRLKELNTIYLQQKNAKIQNTVAMKDTLRQAEKEAGDYHTNKHEVTGKNGESLSQPIADALSQFNKMLGKVYGSESTDTDS